MNVRMIRDCVGDRSYVGIDVSAGHAGPAARCRHCGKRRHVGANGAGRDHRVSCLNFVVSFRAIGKNVVSVGLDAPRRHWT
jgi:hypothetical protein